MPNGVNRRRTRRVSLFVFPARYTLEKPRMPTSLPQCKYFTYRLIYDEVP